MKGWFLIERADGTEYFVCKKCGHSADVPYDRCPECGGEETMINKAHLRPKDFDNNGDIIPMACKEEKGDRISREALKKQVKELLDLAVKRVDDTPNNSPCYRMYVAQEDERARLIDLIDNAPSVTSYTLEDLEKAKNNGYKWGKIDGKKERMKGDIIVAGKCPIEADGNCPLKQQGEWVRREDIIHLLERWSDGYSYIEIPTDTAIKAIKEMKGGAENEI